MVSYGKQKSTLLTLLLVGVFTPAVSFQVATKSWTIPELVRTGIPGRLLTLSDHPTIGPPQVHPNADEANAIGKKLCEKYGIVLPNIDSYNDMSSYMYPKATTERLVVINLWMDFLWFIDDFYETKPLDDATAAKSKDAVDSASLKILKAAVDIICRGTTPAFEHKLFPACHAIHKTLKDATIEHPKWLETRFYKALSDHLMATIHTTEQEAFMTKNENNSIDPFAYMVIREEDGGMYPSIAMLDIAFDVFLPMEILEHAYIKRLVHLCNRIATYSNDVFSYEKECVKMGTRFNLVAAFEDSCIEEGGRKLTFDEAVHCVISILTEETNEFLSLVENVPNVFGEHQEGVEKFVTGLADAANSAYWWQLATDRYRSPTSPFPELRD